MGVMPRQIRYFPMAPKLDKVTPAVPVCGEDSAAGWTLIH